MSSINYDELMQPVIAFLGCETPKEWLNEALNNLDILMQDHANCEKKAAGTALLSHNFSQEEAHLSFLLFYGYFIG
nr:tRNA isopentenyl-2-thiomethyl-A-37 hydroxylase MiaE [Acinetobacter towneri]